MRQLGTRFLKNEDGAIAPLYALSLTALIAVGGIAFDYSRMASMDTELQNAADQAALAAASQLDGTEDATMRAANAASQMVANQTRFSNDGNGRDVAVAEVTFYSCETNACRDDRTGANMTLVERDDDAVDDDVAARYVGVRVANRRSFYALTPIVNAISSGDMAAGALAGMGSAICRVPPVMMCNPDEPSGGTDTELDFDGDAYEGAGVRLVANDGGGGYGPGVFGFLEVGVGSNLPELREAFGHTTPPGDCVAATGVDVSPGNMVSVRDSLNVRFDIYDNGSGLQQTCTASGSLCPPSANTRKDVLIAGVNPAGHANFQPAGGPPNTWRLPNDPDTQHYPPLALTTKRYLNSTEIGLLWPMGYPRDVCHSTSITGVCTDGRIGDKDWDRNAYFRSNSASYPSPPTSGDLVSWFGTATPTRYQVYRWEILNAGTRLVPQSIPGLNGNNSRTSRPQPVNRTGITPGDETVDRRRLSVAVINCEAEDVGASSDNIRVRKWIDVFLVEPTIPRRVSENSDIYVEIIGETEAAGGGGTTGQVVRRDTPYLIE